MRIEFKPVYVPEMDTTVIYKMTFVGLEMYSIEISGWYFGEIDTDLVDEYKENNDVCMFPGISAKEGEKYGI